MLSPLQWDMPMKTSEPTPAAIRPGHQDQGKRRATEPGGLDDEDGGHDRRAEDDRDGCEAAGRGEHGHELRRCVAPDEVHRVHREPGAERDEGRLGAEDEPEADARPPGQHHARDDARLGAAHLQAVGRHMPSRSRQADDRERHRQAGDAEHEQIPPRRNRVPPEVVRQIREQPLLGVVHDLEERPRDERDDNPDDGSEHQDRDEVLAPQDRQGIGCRSGRCGRVGHRAISCLVIRRPYSGPRRTDATAVSGIDGESYRSAVFCDRRTSDTSQLRSNLYCCLPQCGQCLRSQVVIATTCRPRHFGALVSFHPSVCQGVIASRRLLPDLLPG